MEGSFRTPDPTPEQIKRWCKKIQRGWSSNTFNSRRQGPTKPDPWVVPIISIDTFELAVQEIQEEE